MATASLHPGYTGPVRDRVEGARDAFAELGLAMRPDWTRFCRSNVEIARAADPVSDRTFVLSVSVKIQR